MFSRSHPILILIERNGFSFFQDTQQNILKFAFTQGVVSNLDISNKSQFVNLLATFIKTNKIIPSSLGIILSDSVIYFKDFPNSAPKTTSKDSKTSTQNANKDLAAGEALDKDHKKEIQDFLENVPFEDVLAKVIKSNHADRVVSANKDLIMTIADTFTNNGSVLEAIVPGFMFAPKANFSSGLNRSNIQAVLGGAETIRMANMLTDQQKFSSPKAWEEAAKDPSEAGLKGKSKNLRQYILIGVFCVLLVVLGIVFYINMIAPSSKPKRQNIPVANSKISPTLIPSVSPAVATAAATVENTKVKILQGSPTSSVSANINRELLEIGFKNIDTETSLSSKTQKPSVVFSQAITTVLKDLIVEQLNKHFGDVAVLESNDTDPTITISTGSF